MANEQEEGEELLTILQAVEQYNARATAGNRVTRLTLLLALGEDEPFALLAGPALKTAALDPTKLQ